MSWVKPKSIVGQDVLNFAPFVQTASVSMCLSLRAVRTDDLDAVAALERRAYAFPWSIQNFSDSLVADYDFWALVDANGLQAYALVMWLPDEAHLLNITVEPERQGLGIGRQFLTWLLSDAQARGAQSLMLEVRCSNPKALALYVSMGFSQIGTRKGYYPSWNNTREDALVLSKPLLA